MSAIPCAPLPNPLPRRGEGAQKTGETSAPSLLLPHPGLRPAKQRHADEAAHLELFAALHQFHLAAIDLAFLRIEDLAAGVLTSVLPQTPQNVHAHDRLILARALALAARMLRILSRLRED